MSNTGKPDFLMFALLKLGLLITFGSIDFVGDGDQSLWGRVRRIGYLDDGSLSALSRLPVLLILVAGASGLLAWYGHTWTRRWGLRLSGRPLPKEAADHDDGPPDRRATGPKE